MWLLLRQGKFMKGPTHALAGACTAAAFVYLPIPHTYPVLALSAVAAFAALVPDLDGSESTLEHLTILSLKPFKIPAYVVGKMFKHRGFLHSLMALALLSFILLGFFPNLPKEIVYASLLGYFSHLVTDALTPAGIPWLYPYEDWRPSLLPDFLCIRTGSFAETIFFVGLLVGYAIFLEQAVFNALVLFRG